MLQNPNLKKAQDDVLKAKLDVMTYNDRYARYYTNCSLAKQSLDLANSSLRTLSANRIRYAKTDICRYEEYMKDVNSKIQSAQTTLDQLTPLLNETKDNLDKAKAKLLSAEQAAQKILDDASSSDNKTKASVTKSSIFKQELSPIDTEAKCERAPMDSSTPAQYWPSPSFGCSGYYSD